MDHNLRGIDIGHFSRDGLAAFRFYPTDDSVNHFGSKAFLPMVF